MEGWEERESKEGKEKEKKTKQNRAKEINRERLCTNQWWAKQALERQRDDLKNPQVKMQ
jgi:hypothetical protein